MFDIGWTELVVVAIVAILVVGPKDLPGLLRGFGKTMSSMRRMARDFQKQFDDALKEAELHDVKKIGTSKAFKPLDDARKSMQAYQDQVRDAMKDTPPAPAAKPAEPAPAEPGTKGAAGKAARPAKRSTAKAAAGGKSSAAKKPTARSAATKKAPARKAATAKAGKKRAGTTGGNE